jgi:hypothetical protein
MFEAQVQMEFNDKYYYSILIHILWNFSLLSCLLLILEIQEFFNYCHIQPTHVKVHGTCRGVWAPGFADGWLDDRRHHA